MIPAGRLDRRITISRRTTTQDALGGVVETWSPLCTVWAACRPLTGREYFAAMQVNAEIAMEFTIRWREGITPLDRVTFDGRDYDVVHVAEIGRREGLLLLGKARAE